MDFTATRAMFDLPEGVIYLDGNSLGPLPKAAAERVSRTVQDEWGEMLITGWNRAGWMAQPSVLGDRIGALLGAPTGSVVLGDTLSVKIYQALAAALHMRPDRKVILSDSGNFPSDLYMAQGLIAGLDKGHELRVVAPEEVADAITEEVAALMITEVDYRTGRRHDMPALTAKRRQRRAGDLGSGAFGGRRAGGSDRRQSRFRLWLHLQVSERRPRRARLHLCGPTACRHGATGPVRLAWA